ncbi:ABC transporter substrate-binding protein, partial [Lactobacillus crispatus]
MDKIDSYVRHFLILIALILGLSLVSELREIIAYDSSTIGIIS